MPILFVFLAAIGANEGIQFAKECDAKMAADPSITTCVQEGVNELSNTIQFSQPGAVIAVGR